MGKRLSEMTLEELWILFPIKLTEHNADWKRQYEEKAAFLEKKLSSYNIVRISHIGSTAVNNIWAKPIVDILVEIASDENMAAVAGTIADGGFIKMSESEDRISFNFGYTENGFAPEVYHLHLRYAGDNDELYFRDYLNDNPGIAKEYEQLKLKLWHQYEHNRDAYTEAKTEFVKKHTANAKKQYGNRYAPEWTQTIRVTVLIENTSKNELACEHGLSLLIEHEGKKILLDAGSTEAFAENAAALEIRLHDIDLCVLSHGHYDHSGGFEALFRVNKAVRVQAEAGASGKYYSENGGMHEIGIPEKVLAYKDRFVFDAGIREIAKGVYLIPHSSAGLEIIGERARLYREVKGKIVPDDFSHELSLVIDTEKGLVIFNSCSHGGVRNIIREVREACDGKRVYAYVGGLHMKGKRHGEDICTFSEEEVDALCEVIKAEGVRYVYTGHCTGLPGLAKLRERLGDTVRGLTTGLKFEL